MLRPHHTSSMETRHLETLAHSRLPSDAILSIHKTQEWLCGLQNFHRVEGNGWNFKFEWTTPLSEAYKWSLEQSVLDLVVSERMIKQICYADLAVFLSFKKCKSQTVSDIYVCEKWRPFSKAQRAVGLMRFLLSAVYIPADCRTLQVGVQHRRTNCIFARNSWSQTTFCFHKSQQQMSGETTICPLKPAVKLSVLVSPLRTIIQHLETTEETFTLRRFRSCHPKRLTRTIWSPL